jgi:hypothetical protein
MLICALCVGAFAQNEPSYYVSARGNDANDGLSEATPFKTLLWATFFVFVTGIQKITVIGTLDAASEDLATDADAAFLFISNKVNIDQEILITGKPGATGADRAILSAKGSGKGVIAIGNKYRFEHIEISGGEGETGSGIFIGNGGNVTLGQGVVVRNNSLMGIAIGNGTCIIDGGEVRDNKDTGIMVSEKGILTMQNGTIRDNPSNLDGGGVYVKGSFTMSGGTINGNRADRFGGGVIVTDTGAFTMSGGTITGNRVTTYDGGGVSVINGRFNMTGGTITGNRSTRYGGGVIVSGDGRFDQTGGTITGNSATGGGGGVVVRSGARFDQTGGTISGNTAGKGSNPNVYRETGALGSNLTPGSSGSTSSSSGSQSSTSTQPSSGNTKTKKKSDASAGFSGSLGFYLNGINENVLSVGMPLQLGAEISFSNMALCLLGEAGIGIGQSSFSETPASLLEWHYGGMGEFYFPEKIIGLGFGYGMADSKVLHSYGLSSPEAYTTSYMRFSFIVRRNSKFSLYGQLYGDRNFGIGMCWGWFF